MTSFIFRILVHALSKLLLEQTQNPDPKLIIIIIHNTVNQVLIYLIQILGVPLIKLNKENLNKMLSKELSIFLLKQMSNLRIKKYLSNNSQILNTFR